MSDLLPRERVWRAFNREPADRLPLDLGSKGSSLGLGAYGDLKALLGIDKPTRLLDQRLGLAVIDEEVLDLFKIDTRYIYLKPAASFEPQVDAEKDTITDEWGGTLKRPSEGYYYDHVDFPLKEPAIETVERHAWPDPDDPSRYTGLKEEAKKYHDQGFAVGTYLKGVNETIWILRGLENAFLDMGLNKKFYHALADRVSSILARMVENLMAEAGEYIQWLCVTCDLGTQNNLLISKDYYRQFVRPYEGRIFDAVRKNPPTKVAQHSCGAIFPIIPDLIDAGVEILNPIQTSAQGMDTAALKREYGAHLCFWGGIDVQKILAFGTVDEVKSEVRRVAGDLGRGGGCLLGPSHDIQTNTPPQNVVALYETALV